MKYATLTALVFSFLSAPVWAGDLNVFPADVTLTGPHASQRLIVLAELDGKFNADLTGQANFLSSNPTVASVDKAGVVQARGDGEATVTASHEGKLATANVKVRATKEPFAWSFRNHVIPMMTKVGCNSGACHGALAGKGGFKLSLRGYAPATDHFVMTRQTRGRRVDLQEPAHSLVLLKPTMAVKLGGG